MSTVKGSLAELDDFYRAMLDAMPEPILVVEEDVRVVAYNTATQVLLGSEKAVLRKRGGEALSCLHATESPAGCGHAPACRECVIRNSVHAALEGKQTVRAKVRLELRVEDAVHEIFGLITVSPFEWQGRKLAIIVLEDITELIQLRGILPICAGCKKIRDDASYWQTVEAYLSSRLDVDFTHGLCPCCARRIYPELFEGGEPSGPA